VPFLVSGLVSVGLAGLPAACAKIGPEKAEARATAPGATAPESPDMRDAGSSEEDGGGSSSDAAPDSDAACAPKASVCVDDNTMRIFVEAPGDSGACEYEGHDIACVDNGVYPLCFEGTCRLVVLR
jgi:hypothetical protein